MVVEVCPSEANGLAECMTYVELAQVCTVTCSDPPDLFEDPGYRCGFVGGECTVLPSGPSAATSGETGSGAVVCALCGSARAYSQVVVAQRIVTRELGSIARSGRPAENDSRGQPSLLSSLGV